MDSDLVQQKLCQFGTEWIFNPPSSSYMGRVWERQIRTIRQVLAGILCEHGERLDEESFQTYRFEVEAIVNSRPITLSLLVTLQNRQKWIHPKRNIAIGDIVAIKEENQPRSSTVVYGAGAAP